MICNGSLFYQMYVIVNIVAVIILIIRISIHMFFNISLKLKNASKFTTYQESRSGHLSLSHFTNPHRKTRCVIKGMSWRIAFRKKPNSEEIWNLLDPASIESKAILGVNLRETLHRIISYMLPKLFYYSALPPNIEVSAQKWITLPANRWGPQEHIFNGNQVLVPFGQDLVILLLVVSWNRQFMGIIKG